VQVADVTKIRDTDGAKLAEVRLGSWSRMNVSRRSSVDGSRKGKFTPEAPVVFRFKGSDKEFTFDKLMH